MIKQIKIVVCKKCPYSQYDKTYGCWVCNHNCFGKVSLDDPNNIPEWCLLETYKKE